MKTTKYKLVLTVLFLLFLSTGFAQSYTDEQIGFNNQKITLKLQNRGFSAEEITKILTTERKNYVALYEIHLAELQNAPPTPMSLLTCNVSTSERDALVALYNATGGANWTTNTNWNTTADVCDWYGVTVLNDQVTKVVLNGNNLIGTIPSSIGDLSNLIEINLSDNQISGSIPSNIDDLSVLEILDLRNNSLTGSIPTSIVNITPLKSINLSTNNLTGSIPSNIGNLTNLTTISLSINPISGTLPTSLGNLTNVTYLSLNANDFTGSIPTEIGNMTSLLSLSITSSQITGSIPTSLGNLLLLESLDLGSNNLTGSIPTEIGNLTLLEQLLLYNNQITGVIPSTIGNLTNLISLWLYNNQLSGSIPLEIGNLSSLKGLTLNQNQLTGEIPSTIWTMSNLTYLGLFGNQLSGSIPPEIENLESLSTLILSWNQFTGEIPSTIGKLSNLRNLWLHYNQFTGEIPSTIGNLSNLTQLILYNNQLSGTIPAAIGSITTLGTFVFQNNAFVFCDFVTEHPTYLANLTNYTYSPQAKVDEIETIDVQEGNNQTLTTSLNCASNSYQWYKDGVAISGATDNDYMITGATSSDAGVYHFLVTNAIVTGLTLERHPITLTVHPCAVTAGSVNGTQTICSGGDPSVLGSVSLPTGGDGNFAYLWQDSSDGSVWKGITGATATTYDPPSGLSVTTWYRRGESSCSNTEYTNSVIITVEKALSAGTNGTLTICQGETVTSGELFTSLGGTPDTGGTWSPALAGAGTYTYTHAATANCPAVTADVVVSELNCSSNTFCTSQLFYYPTVADLTPSGTNIQWYLEETDGTPLLITEDIEEFAEDDGGIVYWWDDTTDGIFTRTAATITINKGTPIGDQYQSFSIGQNATVADLVMGGTNVLWYDSGTSQIALSISTPLVDGSTYYAEDVGTSTCRLEVDVFVGTHPPNGNGLQFMCSNQTIGDLVVELEVGATVAWYLTTTGGSTQALSTTLVDGTTYYAAQIDADSYESVERKAITVEIIQAPPPIIPGSTQVFYSDESQLVGDLLVKGSIVLWYNQATGGTALGNLQVLDDGQTYFAEQTVDGCISARQSVLVNILTESIPDLVGCEKFIPKVGDRYVINGWVREQGLEIASSETKQFDDSEFSELFTDLLNHLKDKLLNSEALERDIPETYIPESATENINFDPLIPFIEGIQINEKKLTVYDFAQITDSRGITIGFEFYLNLGKTHRFEYLTPEITVPLCSVCLTSSTITFNYPLLNNGFEILEFTSARVDNGQLKVRQIFSSVNPVLDKNEEVVLSNVSGIASSVLFYNYVESLNYQPMNYLNALVKLIYKDASGTIIPLGAGEVEFSPQGAIIDGWQKVSGEFTIPSNAAQMTIALQNNGTTVNAFFDDIRVHPYDSNMKTFVYHPVTQRLMSELDENNYATFYEYDAEGGLIRVKKETEKGVYTIQETRSGTIKVQN